MVKQKINFRLFSKNKVILFLLIVVLAFFFFGCKSTKETTNNQLDISKEKIESVENNIKVTQLTSENSEITLLAADPKKPITITDKKGHTQKFENVKSVVIKKQTEQKKDSLISEKKDTSLKETDTSTIKKTSESISDAVQYKWISTSIAILGVCLLIIFLVSKFKK